MPTRRLYTVSLTLENRVCMVVGGGHVAERKVRGLLPCGAIVRLVTEDLTPWLQTQCDEGVLFLAGAVYHPDLLLDVDLVFAATNDWALNRTVAVDAAVRGLWCNMATEPERGTFIVPSLFQRGPLTIAVSTGGASPATAVRIRQKLEREFGEEWTVLLHLMALLRVAIQTRGLESARNQDLYRKISDLPLLEWLEQREENQLVEAIAEICHPWIDQTEIKHIWNEAWKLSS